jgi:K+ transporter
LRPHVTSQVGQRRSKSLALPRRSLFLFVTTHSSFARCSAPRSGALWAGLFAALAFFSKINVIGVLLAWPFWIALRGQWRKMFSPSLLVPAVLFVAVVGLVLGFETSTRLAAAYGIAVTGTLAIDTILFFVVVRLLWNKPRWLAIGGAIAFLIVDLGFFAANIPKITHGGWFPLAIASLAFTTLMTWRAGRVLLRERMLTGEMPIDVFLARLATNPPARVPGTAVFLTSTGPDTPRALLHNVQHNHVLHEHVVLFTAVTEGRPTVPPDEQLRITDEVVRDRAVIDSYLGAETVV